MHWQLKLRINKESFTGEKSKNLAEALKTLAHEIECPDEIYCDGQIEDVEVVLDISADAIVDCAVAK